MTQVRDEHGGAEVDVGVLADQREPHPDVLVERGGVEQPDALVAQVAGELGQLDVARPGWATD